LTPLKKDFLKTFFSRNSIFYLTGGSALGIFYLDHFEDAKRKEGALDPSMISFLLSKLKLDTKPDYLLEDMDLLHFQTFVKKLETDMANMSFPTG